jgi:hypothetical protein
MASTDQTRLHRTSHDTRCAAALPVARETRQCPCDWQYPQWLQGTVGSIRQGPPDSGSA